MTPRFKQLTIDLQNELSKKTYEFLLENIEDDCEMKEVINVVLSSHISSLYNTMTKVCSDNLDMKKEVGEFLEKILSTISSLDIISEVEIIEKIKG